MTAPEDPRADDSAGDSDDVDAAPAEVLVGQAADPRAEVLAEHPDGASADSAFADVDAGDEAFDRGADPAH